MNGVADYIRPASIPEAIRVLADAAGTARPIAGGTDLVVQMQAGRYRPEILVDVTAIPELCEIRLDGTDLIIGATVTHSALHESPLVRRFCPLLADIAHQVGSIQIQNAGTVGGNLVNASPAADMALGLVALRASVHIAGDAGERILPIDEFFTGPGRTVLQLGDIVTRVTIAGNWFDCRSGFMKIGRRRAHPIAVVSVAVALRMEDDGRCRDASLAMGAVASTPVRSPTAEEALRGTVPDSAVVAEAARAAVVDCSPISDVRASAGYRRDMVEVLARRALTTALMPRPA